MTCCTVCGTSFPTRPTGGRPRTRCDQCRTNHGRNDGKTWRELRRRVLAEEPVCCVPGCGRSSSQVDHTIPLALRPDLGLERSNLRGICARHNAQKGAKVNGVRVDTPPRQARRARALSFFDDEPPTSPQPDLRRDPDYQRAHGCTCDPPRWHWCL